MAMLNNQMICEMLLKMLKTCFASHEWGFHVCQNYRHQKKKCRINSSSSETPKLRAIIYSTLFLPDKSMGLHHCLEKFLDAEHPPLPKSGWSLQPWFNSYPNGLAMLQLCWNALNSCGRPCTRVSGLAWNARGKRTKRIGNHGKFLWENHHMMIYRW